jgi:hypothetical protein
MTDQTDAAPKAPNAARPPTWERPPFFVEGYVRSGTTLFRRMLDMHPDLYVLREMDEFQRIPKMIRKGIANETALKAFMEALPNYFRNCNYDLDQFAALATPRLPLAASEAIFLLKSSARIAAEKPGARWGHKEPHEWPFVYRLREWYPKGQFLHIIRRPHDVVASVEKYRDIGLHSVRTTPVISAWHWRTSYRSVCAQGETLGQARYLLLRYEDLVDDPRETLGKVVNFLGVSLGGVPLMLEFHKKPLPSHKGAHMSRAREPVTKEAQGRGERSLSEALRRDIDWICRKEISTLNYAPLGSGSIGPLRKLTLGTMCLAYDVIWAGMRASRRARGQL